MAMATEADVTTQRAGAMLVFGGFSERVRFGRLKRAVTSNFRINLAFVISYNALGVLVAAGVLCFVIGILLYPILALPSMGLPSASVIGNALRLRILDL